LCCCRRRKIFFRRQSDSSLIVGRIIDPRPGLCALLMDPFVPCVTHWCTIYPSFHVVLRPRQKDERYASRCHSKSTNLFFWFRKYSRTVIASQKQIEVLQNTRPLVISYHVARHYFTGYVYTRSYCLVLISTN
jgi:hypothetical protein